MRITGCEILHCNAGWRDFSFLKLNTDENIIGIAEFNECYGSPGLSGVIRRLVDRIKDMDAIAHERIHQYLYDDGPSAVAEELRGSKPRSADLGNNNPPWRRKSVSGSPRESP